MQLDQKATRFLFLLGGISISLSLFLGSLVSWAHGHSSQTQTWVDLSYRTRLRLAAVVRLTLDAETAARGYSLTQNPEFLEPLEQASQQAGSVLDQLQEFLAGNPAEVNRVTELRAAVRLRLEIARQTVASVPANLPRLIEAGKNQTDIIRVYVAALEQQERQRLTTRLASRARAESLLAALSWTLLLTQCLLWLALGHAVRRWMRSEGLARVCAWSKTVEYNGEWLTFEDYLRKRFGIATTHGISPAEAAKLARELEKAQPRQ